MTRTSNGRRKRRGSHLFEKAIELDPQFSRAYAELSYLYVREFQNGWSGDSTASLVKAEQLAKKALAINDDFDGRWNLAIVYWNKGEFEKSFIEYEAARKFNPNNPDLAADMAEALIYGGEPEKAIAQIKEAMLRNPKIPTGTGGTSAAPTIWPGSTSARSTPSPG